MHYDLIGDIHGYAQPLIGLLQALGYRKEGTVYRHPDKSGHWRKELRIAWWRNAAGKTCRQMAVKDEELVPELPFPREHWSRFPGYAPTKPLVFIGHYSLEMRPAPLLPNLVCVDLGVTGGRGLAAYRWQGEKEVTSASFETQPSN